MPGDTTFRLEAGMGVGRAILPMISPTAQVNCSRQGELRQATVQILEFKLFYSNHTLTLRPNSNQFAAFLKIRTFFPGTVMKDGNRDKFARDHLDEVIRRLRENPSELDRIKGSLGKYSRTLGRDVDGAWEERVPGRKIDAGYMHAVCNAFLNRFTSAVYNSVINVVVDDSNAQNLLKNMLGKYRAYWPSGKPNSFASFSLEITETDGAFAVASVTGDAHFKYSHFGYAILIRKRVHVLDVRKHGIRSMIFHYEDVPARVPLTGIIMNILGTENDARDGEKLFAAHFVAFHENDGRFQKKVPDEEIARLLHHDANRTGVIRV